MNKLKITNQSIKRVPLAEMVAQSGYQRPTEHRQVRNIVNRFDESQLGILTVSQREGKYHIIDGNHRSHALRDLGFTHALCIVLTGLTKEEEADLFARQNQDKRMLKPYDTFKAGLEAGHEIPVGINEIVKANGFQISAGGTKTFNRITAIQALMTIEAEYGFNVLDDTLCLIAGTWHGLTKATQGACLLGVAEFVSRYGMAEFSERMKEKCMVVWYYYDEEMRNRNGIVTIPPRKRFCRILVEQYNQGISARSKKRLVWDDLAQNV